MKIKKMRLIEFLVRIRPDYCVTVKDWVSGLCLLTVTEVEEAKKQLPKRFLRSDVAQVEISQQATKTYEVTIKGKIV